MRLFLHKNVLEGEGIDRGVLVTHLTPYRNVYNGGEKTMLKLGWIIVIALPIFDMQEHPTYDDPLGEAGLRWFQRFLHVSSVHKNGWPAPWRWRLVWIPCEPI